MQLRHQHKLQKCLHFMEDIIDFTFANLCEENHGINTEKLRASAQAQLGQVTEKLRVGDEESTLHVLQDAIPACWKCPINLNISQCAASLTQRLQRVHQIWSVQHPALTFTT